MVNLLSFYIYWLSYQPRPRLLILGNLCAKVTIENFIKNQQDSVRFCKILQDSARVCKILQESARYWETLETLAKFYETPFVCIHLFHSSSVNYLTFDFGTKVKQSLISKLNCLSNLGYILYNNLERSNIILL